MLTSMFVGPAAWAPACLLLTGLGTLLFIFFVLALYIPERKNFADKTSKTNDWHREPVKEGGWRLIGLVPCAVGGTRIQEWSRGSVLYQHMIGRTKAALTSGGKIGAVLWYQGESDTVKHEDAYSYRARLEKLIFDLRTDLQLPHLLFIQVFYLLIHSFHYLICSS